MKAAIATLVVLALASDLAWAQEAQETSPVASVAVTKPLPSTPQPVPNPLPLTFKSDAGSSSHISLYLGLMLALVGGGFFLLRNGVAIFQPKLKGERKLNINETRMLGNRQFLVVAQYQDRKVLLGVCPGRIEYLCTLAGGESDFPKLAPEGGDA
jgi:flagellar biogenesis protein FliO